MTERLSTIKEVSERYGVGHHTVLAWITTGQLRACQRGAPAGQQKISLEIHVGSSGGFRDFPRSNSSDTTATATTKGNCLGLHGSARRTGPLDAGVASQTRGEAGFRVGDQQERSESMAEGARSEAVAKKTWCVPNLTPEFRERMEDVLDQYEKPYDSREPVICMDEQPYQMLDDVRPSQRAAPARPPSRTTNIAVAALAAFCGRGTGGGKAICARPSASHATRLRLFHA